MAKILRLRGDQHRQTQSNLPWYVTGQLNERERGQVEEHLATCACCREELESERELAESVASLPLSTDAGWAELRRRMNSSPRQNRLASQPIRTSRTFQRMGRIGWLLVAQAVAVAAFVYTLVPSGEPAPYRTLSAPAASEAANAIIIFRPGVSEAELRQTLTENGARIVDGPTASGAFALRVPEDRRQAVIGNLQQDSTVALAQPIEAEPAR